ncbi:MAG: zinc-binding dehydrogenase [Rhodospirillaceae bacterium]|nr:zinc-binding dehydrogenase [Rhodospirillaceae bacterium]
MKRLRLPIDRVFKLERAAEAQATVSANAQFGKIVLAVRIRQPAFGARGGHDREGR